MSRTPTHLTVLAILTAGTLGSATALRAQELAWAGFRGTHHDGVARTGAPPTEWSDEKNLKWKVALPGPGASSPIIVGERIYVNCYKGFGAHLDDGGDRKSLRHVLACLDRKTGKLIWENVTDGPLDKEPRRMQLSEHGFASPTPICDGERIYNYLGKPGVVAVDMNGKTLWQTDLGKPDPNAPKPTNTVVRNGQTLSLRWGTAASPVLHDGMVIVNCSEQSNSIRALDCKTGKLIWKREHANLEGSAITPIVAGKGDAAVVVIALGGSIWGLAPKTGKLLWEVETGTRGGMSPTPLVDGDLVYAFGGSGKSFALHYAADYKAKATDVKNPATGEGAETPTSPRVVWNSANVGIPSPTLYDGKIYLVDQTGSATCISAKDGKILRERERLDGRTGKLYASAVVAGGHFYVVSHKRGTFVYKTTPELELVSRNELDDDSKFNGSPAIVGNELYLRSDEFLYCIAATK